MYLRSHAQKYIPGVYLHVCKFYTRVNLAHANWTLDIEDLFLSNTYKHEELLLRQTFVK